MPLSRTQKDNQDQLKLALQGDKKASKLESLAAALLGRLLGVPVAVARSGFQHGGDAGPAGRHGRRFRLECKKYSDTTSLSDRELLGEIDHALARDEALEAWCLIATRSVPEQLLQDLTKKGERIGVPVVVLDWKDHDAAPLAALCGLDPDLVGTEFSKEAGECARALQPGSADAIAMLRRELQSWCLGFEALRLRSHEKLDAIWTSPRTSNAELGQNAAGGAQNRKVKRKSVHEAFNAWWQGPALEDAPAAVVGWDGVGKTWAVLDWLVDSKGQQPVVLIIPSSAVVDLSGVSETSVKRFLADRLYELSKVGNREHWLRRLDYLLKRPTTEGPVLTVFFDGLNQEPSVPWLPLLKVLQGDTFAGRVRVVASTRNYHFDDKLSKLRGLIVPAVAIPVDPYDAKPGGELDQMLAFQGLTRADLHPDLVDLARTPRLFKLVVKFRENVEAGQVTVHRLLWEYGRDTFGVRAGRSFSEVEWQAWLKDIAQKYRDGVQDFSVKSLADTASRPDLTEREVYARLSDIIDGRFASADPSGNLHFTPTVVAHALAAALLAKLDAVTAPTFESLDADLTQWLDPIAGFDQRAEILRAAVSILVEQGRPATSPVAGVLVTAWLQSQNVTDGHRREIANLAPQLTDALLDAIERSNSRTHASARLWGANALRAIPRADATAQTTIVTRLRRWFSIVSRDVDPRPDANADFEKRRSQRLKRRIGVDRSGPITVIAVDLELVEQTDGALQAAAPAIIDGFPLAGAIPIFEAAAVALAVRGRSDDGWDGLKWLCILNEGDPDETAAALRDLSKAVRSRTPEPGVHPDLPARVAALLLWLTGQEVDEDAAASINPGLDRALTYEKDYLPQPGHSLFPLERRHAETALNDTERPLRVRVQRTKGLWLDPSFEPPAAFLAEVRAAVAPIDVEKLDRHIDHSIEDYGFEELEPVLARCAPDLLADLIHRKMLCVASCPPESRYWSALHATDHLMLAGKAEAAAARTLRLGGADADANREVYAASQLLVMEIRDLDTRAQFDALIRADLKYISTDFTEVLHPPTPHDVDALINRYTSGPPKRQHDLLILLSIHPIEFSDRAWSWLEGFAKQEGHGLRGLAFQALTRADVMRFGRTLMADGWSWSPDLHFWVNHYGTGALIEATPALPFDQLAPRLAPWRLFEAARRRGADPAEVRLAAEIFSHVLAAERVEAPDPGSILSVDRTQGSASPFVPSVSLQLSPKTSADAEAALSAATDADARTKALRRAVEIAKSRIQQARSSGASLYLADFDADDFEPVLRHAPDMVGRWLEGLHEPTSDFRRRVRLAEAAFLALCEALLAYDPERGVQLWRALPAVVMTRYIGAAVVDDLLHMIFRVPDSQTVSALREEVVGLGRCHTDKALFDLAIAASYNGKIEWLSTVIEKDRASAFAWRRNRGEVLAGFTVHNTLPVENAWPDSEIKTNYAQLRHRSAHFQWSEACAHHWWRVYLTADEPAQAYAAWVLFLRSADRRAQMWMGEQGHPANDSGTFLRLKLTHAELNRSKLKRAMEKRTDKVDKTFLGREIVEGVGPWGKESGSE